MENFKIYENMDSIDVNVLTSIWLIQCTWCIVYVQEE